MNSRRSFNNDGNEKRLSSFGQKLQSLSDTYYSTILEDTKETKIQIKTAKQLEDYQSNDFTFDACSTTQITSNDDFSFTFHSLDQPKIQKHQTTRINHSSTPCSIHQENLIKKQEDETIVVEENRPSIPSPRQPIIVGYYPVISYQPVCLPPTIYLSKEQIQSQINDYSTLTKITPIRKK